MNEEINSAADSNEHGERADADIDMAPDGCGCNPNQASQGNPAERDPRNFAFLPSCWTQRI